MKGISIQGEKVTLRLTSQQRQFLEDKSEKASIDLRKNVSMSVVVRALIQREMEHDALEGKVWEDNL